MQMSTDPNPKRPKRRSQRNWHKFVAGLLSALFPGLGHIYLGLYIKGLTFIFLLLLDLTALFYFSSIGIQINVPLIILLSLVIPVIYFINIYDVLQLADWVLMKKRRSQAAGETNEDSSILRPGIGFMGWERGISFGMLLIFGGSLMVLFVQKPRWLELYLAQFGLYAVGAALVIAGLLLLNRELILSLSFKKRRMNKSVSSYLKIRIGRYTASILLMVVGILLIIDKVYQTEYVFSLINYWPFILVIWGIEFIIAFLLNQVLIPKAKRISHYRFRPDFKGILSASVLVCCIFIVTQQDHYAHLWNRVSLNLSAASLDYSEAADNQIEKETISIPVEMETGAVVVENVNGDIRINRGDVESIIVKTIAWVDQVEPVEAQAVADASKVNVQDGKTIQIATEPQGYGSESKRQPRMNMTITIPDDRRFDLQVITSNGSVYLDRPEAISSIHVESGNGKIYIHNAIGDVHAKTLNGNISVADVIGSAVLSTNRGDLRAEEVTGSADLTTLVGRIQASDIVGDITGSTRNGNITVNEPVAKLSIETLNGAVQVHSKQIGGDWDIYSAVGDILLVIPEAGDYEVSGSSTYGNLNVELPYTIENRMITGVSGTGEYKVHVEGNSDVTIQRSTIEDGTMGETTDTNRTNQMLQ
ncbi:DUF4097 family beta strand repeat-containing protein [Paenibacillus provencensis]|uniref:DUF4097 family beta strand repeat-containing protein n=1 Tax=Paenibacillus provencensis TaxID=441151 RepID=A0ABW3Q0D7_9BACL|nr:DUF4097 family beta strand repeat-containing protein [Paenibacillus sp. MER 78]MCM3130376.1 DUF4097 domain-containing protein [Paenibacillus sp. MER 78]